MSLEAVVEFEYTAEQNDELSLKVGDRIINIQSVEEGWYEGELNGKRGMFPDNFVKLVKPLEPDSKKTELQREVPQRKSVRELANKFKDSIPVGPSIKKEKQKRCRVLFEYTKVKNDELDLAVGDIIEFQREVEDGWSEGILNGKQGIFPSNFVEMLEDMPTLNQGIPPNADVKHTSTDEVTSKNSDFNSTKGKKLVDIGLGNLFDSGPMKLRSAGDKAIKEDSFKPAWQEKSEPAPEVTMRNKSHSPLPSSLATEQAVVRFSYTAEQPDELSLVEGQVIRIIQKELEDEGWWKGEINGKIGIFPDNFVELLPNEEKNKAQKFSSPALPVVKGALPKLPEKTPAGDTSNENIKIEPGSQTAVKRLQMPPPVVKKPYNKKSVEEKPEPSIPYQQTNSVKDKPLIKQNSVENHNVEDSATFDDIEPSSQKLIHLTYGRAQGPKKRPPFSALTFNERAKNETSQMIKTSFVLASEKQQPPHLSERPDKPLPVLPPKDYKYKAHPPVETEHLPLTPQLSSAVTSLQNKESHTSLTSQRPPESTKALPLQTFDTSNVQTSKLIEQLKLQLNDLKANFLSKTMFRDLQIQHEKLKLEFENMKKNHSLKIRDLTDEIDAEKKLRLAAQIEIEHLKMSLTESEI